MPVGVSDTKHCQCLFYKSKGGAKPSIEERGKKKKISNLQGTPWLSVTKKINNIMLLRQFGAHCPIWGADTGKWTQSQNREDDSAWEHFCLTSNHIKPPQPGPELFATVGGGRLCSPLPHHSLAYSCTLHSEQGWNTCRTISSETGNPSILKDDAF